MKNLSYTNTLRIKKMSNIKINPAIKITSKITGLTQQEITGIIAVSQKKRFPAPSPRPIAISDRLNAYNGVLSKIDPSKIIRFIPNPTVTLTPAAPRSPDGKGSIGLMTSDANGSCYWDTDPNFSETGTIQMPNFMEGYIFLTFPTISGNNYALELQLTMGAIPAQTLTGRWEIYGPNCLVLFQAATPAQTIITGFKATDEKSMVLISYTPSYDPKTVFGGARFLGCTLTQL
jgi:hypothetical protein